MINLGIKNQIILLSILPLTGCFTALPTDCNKEKRPIAITLDYLKQMPDNVKINSAYLLIYSDNFISVDQKINMVDDGKSATYRFVPANQNNPNLDAYFDLNKKYRLILNDSYKFDFKPSLQVPYSRSAMFGKYIFCEPSQMFWLNGKWHDHTRGRDTELFLLEDADKFIYN